jgi:hypothetical protein
LRRFGDVTLPESTVALEALVAAHEATWDLVGQFLRTVVVVPVLAPHEPGGEMRPLTSVLDDTEVVLVFTTAEGAESVKDRTPYMATMPGVSLIMSLPDGVGIALLAESGNASLAPAMLTAVRNDLRAKAQDRDQT